MLKRIEFTLNLEDPHEAALYCAFKPSLRYRRAGAMIREALHQFLFPPEKPKLVPPSTRGELK